MTLHNLRGEWWGVEIPSMAFGFDINNYADESELMYMLSMEDISDGADSEETLITKKLPRGSWRIICLSAECSEERAAEIVERINSHGRGFIYMNYEKGMYVFAKPTSSLRSLLRSKGQNEKNTLILKQVK